MPTTKHPVSALGRRLVRRVITVLKKNPKAYDQSIPGVDYSTRKFVKPACGSPACVIGWMVQFASEGMTPRKQAKFYAEYHAAAFSLCSDPRSEFAKKIGLTGTQFGNIFQARRWPGKFMSFNSDVTPKQAIRRLEHFLKTGE